MFLGPPLVGPRFTVSHHRGPRTLKQKETDTNFTCKTRGRDRTSKVHLSSCKPAAQVRLSGIVRLAPAARLFTMRAMWLARYASSAVVNTDCACSLCSA